MYNNHYDQIKINKQESVNRNLDKVHVQDQSISATEDEILKGNKDSIQQIIEEGVDDD